MSIGPNKWSQHEETDFLWIWVDFGFWVLDFVEIFWDFFRIFEAIDPKHFRMILPFDEYQAQHFRLILILHYTLL